MKIRRESCTTTPNERLPTPESSSKQVIYHTRLNGANLAEGFERMLTRQLLLAPPALRSSLLMRPALHIRPLPYVQYSSSLQSVIQPSFWASLIPKPLRRMSSPSNKVKEPKSKEWNPATFFIVIFLLIGSMSIQMIALRNSF